jgi:hypothetical protein
MRPTGGRGWRRRSGSNGSRSNTGAHPWTSKPTAASISASSTRRVHPPAPSGERVEHAQVADGVQVRQNEGAAGSQHAADLREPGALAGPVVERDCADHQVERRVGKRQRAHGSPDQPDRHTRLPGGAEHPGCGVHASERGTRPPHRGGWAALADVGRVVRARTGGQNVRADSAGRGLTAAVRSSASDESAVRCSRKL